MKNRATLMSALSNNSSTTTVDIGVSKMKKAFAAKASTIFEIIRTKFSLNSTAYVFALFYPRHCVAALCPRILSHLLIG